MLFLNLIIWWNLPCCIVTVHLRHIRNYSGLGSTVNLSEEMWVSCCFIFEFIYFRQSSALLTSISPACVTSSFLSVFPNEVRDSIFRSIPCSEARFMLKERRSCTRYHLLSCPRRTTVPIMLWRIKEEFPCEGYNLRLDWQDNLVNWYSRISC